jgi:hypothetical protein
MSTIGSGDYARVISVVGRGKTPVAVNVRRFSPSGGHGVRIHMEPWPYIGIGESEFALRTMYWTGWKEF